MTDDDYTAFFAWVEEGKKKGWVSDLVCSTHQGLPNTKEEEDEWEQGFDPCVPGMRVWV